MSKKKKNSCSGSLILLDLRARDRSFTFHWVKGPTLRYFYKKILCRFFFFVCVYVCCSFSLGSLQNVIAIFLSIL